MMYVMSSEGQNQQNEIKFIYILGVSTAAQQANGLAMSQLWRRSQLQLGFDPWAGNFHMLWACPQFFLHAFFHKVLLKYI